MTNQKTTYSGEAARTQLLKNSVMSYLAGQYDWKWVMGVIRQSGMGKREVLDVLRPVKGHGWHFRSQALFTWLEG